MTLEDRLKRQAHALGFELAGIAPATEADGFDRLRDWLAHDYAGEMAYMHRHAEARRHPSSILPEVRSVVMVGMSYLAPDEAGVGREPPVSDASQKRSDPTPLRSVANPHAPRPPLTAKVARYARG